MSHQHREWSVGLLALLAGHKVRKRFAALGGGAVATSDCAGIPCIRRDIVERNTFAGFIEGRKSTLRVDIALLRRQECLSGPLQCKSSGTPTPLKYSEPRSYWAKELPSSAEARNRLAASEQLRGVPMPSAPSRALPNCSRKNIPAPIAEIPATQKTLCGILCDKPPGQERRKQTVPSVIVFSVQWPSGLFSLDTHDAVSGVKGVVYLRHMDRHSVTFGEGDML